MASEKKILRQTYQHQILNRIKLFVFKEEPVKNNMHYVMQVSTRLLC